MARIEKRIAEAKISLSSDEKVLRQIANKYLMNGDQNEGADHEYYVTATYLGKGEQANMVNVLVSNPDYKSQPKEDSPKYPVGKGSVKKDDPEGKIQDAYFINEKGEKITQIVIGNQVKVRLLVSSEMVGKHFQYVVWEYDAGKHDEIYKSGKIKISATVSDTTGFTITKEMFEKGIDFSIVNVDPDSEKQNYFLEIIPLDVSAESVKFGVESNTGLMEVEKTRSPAIVKEQPKEQKKNGECFCNKDFEEKDIRKLIKLLKGTETIWEGQALKGGKRAVCNISDKSFATLTNELNNALKKYKINTCAQKMHFLAQACEETGTFALSEETKSKYLSSVSIYKGRGIMQLTGVKKKDEDRYDAPGPYKDYADYKGDKKIIETPEIVANNVHYAIDSGAWLWSVNKKMTDNPKSAAITKWGNETLGKSLNELAVYVDKYLELISVLLNGRNADTGMPNGWEKRKSNYDTLKTFFFFYDSYHSDNNKSVSAKDVITYHIFSNGEIQKHIPKQIKLGFENKYKYIYHDKNNKEHDVCTVNKVIAQNWIKGSKTDGGKGWEKRTAGKTRYYQKGEGKVELIKIELPINYNKDGVLIKIGDNTDREYINPTSFASMIGAVAECGYSDFNFNGSTSKDGTGAPSVTHVNGVAFDFRYLRKDKSGNNLYINEKPNDLDVVRQEKFIDALIKYGYSKFYSVNITLKGKTFILKNSTNMADHHHHLHIRKEGYSPKYKEVKQ